MDVSKLSRVPRPPSALSEVEEFMVGALFANRHKSSWHRDIARREIASLQAERKERWWADRDIPSSSLMIQPSQLR